MAQALLLLLLALWWRLGAPHLLTAVMLPDSFGAFKGVFKTVVEFLRGQILKERRLKVKQAKKVNFKKLEF